jgi:hypothetical protein
MATTKSKNLIKIDPDEIKILAQEGEKFIFKPKAEEQLIKLLELQKLVDDTVEEVKNRIALAGQTVNPNFKGVIGDRIRCIYRAYGGKYKYDWQHKADCMPFLKEKTSYTVDSDKVEEYIKKVGEMPFGITEADRENKLSIMLKDDEKEERQILE